MCTSQSRFKGNKLIHTQYQSSYFIRSKNQERCSVSSRSVHRKHLQTGPYFRILYCCTIPWACHSEHKDAQQGHQELHPDPRARPSFRRVRAFSPVCGSVHWSQLCQESRTLLTTRLHHHLDKCNIVHYSSIKFKRVTRTAFASELYGMTHGFDQSYVIKKATLVQDEMNC